MKRAELELWEKILRLEMDDPDAANDTFVHWVMYNIPATVNQLDENQAKTPSLPNGAKQGKNGSGSSFYLGPCPPAGMHRYFFKVYALDTLLNLPFGKTKEELKAVMTGHVLKNAEIIGKYQR
jgi:Raf kinase inhibitor-like YbhB/YbcL family protein